MCFFVGTIRPKDVLQALMVLSFVENDLSLWGMIERCCEAVLKPKVMDATRWLKALVSVFVKVNVIFLFVKMVSEDTKTMICSVYLPGLLSKMSMPNYTGSMEQGRRSQRVVWKPRSWYHLVSRHGSQMSYAKNHPVPQNQWVIDVDQNLKDQSHRIHVLYGKSWKIPMVNVGKY